MSVPGPSDFRDLFEQAPSLYLVLDPDLTIVGASENYLRATLTDRESILGRSIFDVFPANPADPESTGVSNLRYSLERVLRERVPDVMAVQRYDIRRPDREGGGFIERHWSPLNSPVLDEHGQLRFIIHEVEDATEFVKLGPLAAIAEAPGGQTQPLARQMEVELFLRARQLQQLNRELLDARGELESQLFRTIFDLMPQIGWTARPDGYIDFYNKGWYEYTGTTFDEMQGWGWEKVHDPAMLPSVVKQWRHSIDTGTPFEMEFPLKGHDGVFRWFLTRVKPMRDDHGELVRWVGINMNVDAERRASALLEERVLARTQELEQLNGELQRLAHVASHEMQAPIATLTSYMNLLSARYQDRLGDDANEFIGKCTHAARRLKRMLDDLWTYARISGPSVEHSPTDLASAAEEAVRTLEPMITARHAVIATAGLPAVTANRAQMVLLFTSLIDNAIRYCAAEPPQVDVTAAQEGDHWLITVRDNGVGIDSIHHTDIFKIYSRIGTETSAESTGMGLAICQRIVEAHGGRISVRSTVGRGSSFEIALPALPRSA